MAGRRLTATEIYRVARQAGFSPDAAMVMTAIALAESGGNIAAYNRNQHELSVGLWQVNTKAHGTKYGNLYDPLANAKAAYAISNGGRNIAPWTVTRSSKTGGLNYATWRPFAEAAVRNAGEAHLLEGTSYWGGTASYSDKRSATLAGGARAVAGAALGATGYTGGGGQALPSGGQDGGFGAASVGGAPTGPTRLAANATPDQIEAFIRENYGADMVGFIKIPELWQVIVDAGREGASPDLVSTRIRKTKWWTERSDSMRQWDILLVTDPAQAKARKEAQMEVLRSVIEQTGADVNLGAFAELTIRLGYNEDQITQHVAGVLRKESGRTGLDEGSLTAVTADTLQSLARNDFFVPLDRQLAEQWAIDIFRGTKTKEMFQAYLGDLSRGRFNHIADKFAGGLTPGEYLAPVRQVIAEALEINVEDIDLLSPEWSEVLEYADPTTGQTRPMTLSEAGRWARAKEGYRETTQANTASGDLVEMLGRTFGRVG